MLRRLLRVFGRRLGVLVLVGAGTLAVAVGVFDLAVGAKPYPLADLQRYAPSVRLRDQHGELLREAVGLAGQRARWANLSAISPKVIAATLATEDARFFRHGGIDPVGVLRAIWDSARAGRIVSGASTVTMQVARLVHPHRRNLRGKLVEMVMAKRLERVADKAAILENYLNRAPYGAGTIGIEAASYRYFSRPSRSLDWAEAALVAGLPNAPTALNPLKHLAAAKKRQRHVLRRLLAVGLIDGPTFQRALGTPIMLRPQKNAMAAMHFTELALRRIRRDRRSLVGDIRTTLDVRWQKQFEGIAHSHLRELAWGDARDLAVVVVDNRRCAVRALLGSANYFRKPNGAVNGATALRQPGSTLKPFTYALAFEKGDSPASVVADIETRYQGPSGRTFSPRNFSDTHHGPVLMGDALGRSLNVTAIRVAQRVGVNALLMRLRALGFGSLKRSAQHYGLGLTLGNGEVTLLELAQAYAVLARGGRGCELQLLVDDKASGPAPRLFSPQVAFLTRQVLSEERLRIEAFGPGNALMLGFPVAVKTGTSTDWRDNWAVGFTDAHTVAVWVGNFSGRSMNGLSGAQGAGPLFARVMRAVVKLSGETPRLAPPPRGVVQTEVCALSGKRPAGHCPHRRTVFTHSGSLGHERCAWHGEVALDRRNGLLAGPHCRAKYVVKRAFARLPARYAAWHAQSGIEAAPAHYSPHCPAAGPGRGALAIVSPRPADVFIVEPGYERRTQTVELRALAEPRAERLRFVLDGRRIATVGWPYHARWKLRPGRHHLRVEADGRRSDEVTFEVR